MSFSDDDIRKLREKLTKSKEDKNAEERIMNNTFIRVIKSKAGVKHRFLYLP